MTDRKIGEVYSSQHSENTDSVAMLKDAWMQEATNPDASIN